MYRNILVGTDGSATATEALDVALRLAGPLGAHVHILAVNDDHVAARGPLAAATTRAAELGVTCSTHISSGHVGRAIVGCASDIGADLVVVGDQGMHGVNRLLTGTVPNFVAHNAPCSVLLVDSTRRATGHGSAPAI
jgi:nucleotide-binding universal stress UspA family protein